MPDLRITYVLGNLQINISNTCIITLSQICPVLFIDD